MRLNACRALAAVLMLLASLIAVPAAAANQSAFVSQSAPTTTALGQTYPVSVTMQNTGDTTWTASALYRLGAQNPQDTNVWSVRRVELPYDVVPGASVTFTFTVTAPTAVGTYNFQWRMVQDNVEWFGPYTDNIAVKDGVNNAVFVSQTVPNTMTPGQSYPVSVTMMNTGNTTWSQLSLYRLGSQNPEDGTTWGPIRIELPGAVAPGQSATFNFIVTAPPLLGTYNFQWQMVEDEVEWFGETTPNIAVKDGQNNAEFVSQSVPSPMVPGHQYPLTVTMRNTGNTVWTPEKLYRLGTQNPQDANTWSVQRVELPNSVAPGETVTFQFTVTAPSRVSTYNAQFQMVEDNVEWFGDLSTNVAVVDGINAASFVSQSVPNPMVPGQTYAVSVTMQNTGNTTWTPDDLYRLGSQNAQDNGSWGLRRIPLTAPVAPGESVTFNFVVTAPAVAGQYNFQWQMVEDTIQWFGTPSDNVLVKDGLNDAAFISQQVPLTMTAGQSYPVLVTMQNTGTTTWTSGALFRLGVQDPQDNTNWNAQRAELSTNVAPGGVAAFNFNVTAPALAGTYKFAWQMVQDNVAWFGAQTNSLPITVQTASSSDDTGLDLEIWGVEDGDTLYESTSVALEVDATASTADVVSTTLQINGVPAVTAPTNDVIFQWNNLQPGTYVISAQAKSRGGQTISKSVTVNVVVNPNDVPFRTVLNNFKTALASGNKDQAMALLSDTAQQEYGPVIDALLPDMAQIVSEWSEAYFVDGTDTSADYAVTRTTDGVQMVYIITFVLDSNGNWLIQSL